MATFETTTEGLVSNASKNQIHFVVDNQTPFTLNAESTTFADWGDFASGPKTVSPSPNGTHTSYWDPGADLVLQGKPFTSDVDAGHVISSRSPFTGSAGMVGYSVKGPNQTVYLRLLGSDPYGSVRNNWAYVSIVDNDEAIDQDHYNKLYDAETGTDSHDFEGKKLTVSTTLTLS